MADPLEEGPACLLFTKEFYSLVRDRLTPGGAMTLQAGMTKLGELDFFTSIHRTLREVFPTGVCDWTQPDTGRPTAGSSQ